MASQDLEIHDHVGDAGLELEEAESVPNAVPGRAFTNDVRKISGYLRFDSLFLKHPPSIIVGRHHI